MAAGEPTICVMDDGDGFSSSAKSRRPRTNITLRTPQDDYLRHVAELELISHSRAFGIIVQRYGGGDAICRRPSKKARRCIVIEPAVLAVLDRLAVEWGVDRSEVARRLIDRARDAEPIILS